MNNNIFHFMQRKHETSSALLIQRIGNGIQLVKPKSDNNTHFLKVTVEHLLQLPMAVYFEDFEHKTKLCNDITVQECGFISMQDCLNAPWYMPFNSKSVIQSLRNDKEIVKHKVFKIFDEKAMLKNGTPVHTLSVRMPWYNSKNNIIGLFGCSIVLGKHSLAKALSELSSIGLLNPTNGNFSGCIDVDVSHSLTRRESECLKLILIGKNTKEIAKILNISPRTVEKYQNNIKSKYNCRTKCELLSYFLPRTY